MPKTKTTPAVHQWLPARGQWFNATLKRSGRLHPAGLFKCSEVVFANDYVHHIEAVDADGDGWQFLVREFRFERAKVVQKAAKGR